MELDALTELYNRGAFDDALKGLVDLASLTAQPVLLMLVDLDHFKRVNDQYGHPVGDAVLVETANTLVRCFPRGKDFIGRYGGEEFAVILWDVEPEHTERLGERLLDAVRELSVASDKGEVKLTCSIGAATLRLGESPADLVRRTDDALYQAKQQGRDRLVIAT
jgi:diguanylate cyclase (GGDEF)-like protein